MAAVTSPAGGFLARRAKAKRHGFSASTRTEGEISVDAPGYPPALVAEIRQKRHLGNAGCNTARGVDRLIQREGWDVRRLIGVVVAAASVAIASFVVLAPATAATSGTISLFAGNGTQGFSGNGGAASAAEFRQPSDEAVSASGTVYIADMKNCQVRQVAPNGTISAFAGVGNCTADPGVITLSGLGAQAVNATIGMPTGVAVDSAGNVYIADCVDYTGTGPGCQQGYILKVSTSGIISIYAGDSTVGNGGSGGQATATSIGAPWGVRTDSAGDVYFSDVVYSVVREVNTSGIISTVAGNGTAGDTGNGGAATSAELNDPTGLYVDGVGNLFIADSKNAVVRKVAANGIITTFAGNGISGTSGNGGLATQAELAKPFGVIEDNAGNVYIADYNAYCVRQVNPSGDISTYAGTCGTSGTSGFGGPVGSALLVGPSQLAFDSSGNLYINDYGGERVDVVSGVESTLPAPSTPTISNLPASATVGGSFTATVTTNSNGVTSVVSNSTGVCTVGTNGLSVSFVGAGTCSLSAQVAASTQYAAASGTAQTVVVALNTPSTPTISNLPTAPTVGGSFTATVTTNSNGVTSVVSNSTGVCTVGTNGLSVSFVGAGTCSLSAQVAASTTYAAAAGNAQTVSVALDTPSTPSISNLPASATVGGSFTATVTTNSNGVTSVVSNSTGVCTVGTNGLSVSFVGAGTCSLSAQVAASTTYAAATGNAQTVSVASSTLLTPSTPTISNLPASATVGGSFTATVTTNSNGVTSVVSNSTGVCTVGTNGLSVSFVGAGTCSLSAQVAASTQYAAASGTAQTVSVALDTPSTPSISNLPTAPTVGGSFTATVTTNSNGVTSVVSNSTGVCTVGTNGLSVSFVGAGTCSLSAQVAASTTYAAASGTAQTVVVALNTPSTPSISNLPTASATVGGSFTATVTTNSNGVTSVVSNSTGVCTVGTNGLSVSFVGAGTCSLSAQVAASTRYAAASGTAQTVVVLKVASGTISLFAGNGTQGFSGNGGAASAAEFRQPSDEAVSASGTVYIADMKNCQVRQVEPNGTISAFAGVGNCTADPGVITLSGLGAQAVNATIGMPTGVAVDSAGNVYIADCVDYTGTGPGCQQGYILKVSTSGIISIYAGDSTVGNGGSGRQATATSIGAPWGVRTDSAGDVYFSDVVYSVVREVNTSGIISTVAGNGTAGDTGNGGAATSAELNDPTGLYVDGVGNLFIADSKNAVVRKVAANGIITTFAGNGISGTSGNGGLATQAELAKPFGVIEDNAGNVYIADYNAYCVRQVNPSGDISTYAGTCGTSGTSGFGGPVGSALLVGPSQLAFDSSGNLYINDYGGERVDVVSGVESTLPAPSTPTISNLPASATVGGSFTATVTTNSNGVTSVVSNSTGVCTVGTNGLSVSFVGAGTCSLSAQVAASTTYGPAFGLAQTVTVAGVRPTVTAVSPSSGAPSGGTTITVTGTGFVAGATVRITQGTGTRARSFTATNVKVVSSTEITAVTGGGARAGTGNLFVTTSGGTSAASSGDVFTYT